MEKYHEKVRNKSKTGEGKSLKEVGKKEKTRGKKLGKYASKSLLQVEEKSRKRSLKIVVKKTGKTQGFIGGKRLKKGWNKFEKKK